MVCGMSSGERFTFKYFLKIALLKSKISKIDDPGTGMKRLVITRTIDYCKKKMHT